jgi:hypothetical protein
MGTDKVTFAGDRTIAHDRKWRELRDRKWRELRDRKWRESRDQKWRESRDRKWHESRDRKWCESRDRKWHQSVSGSMLCTCATGSCATSALVGPFDRKWRQSRDWKRPCPEVALIGSRFSAFPVFPRFFLSSSTVVTWLPKVIWPLRGSLGCVHAQPEVVQYP